MKNIKSILLLLTLTLIGCQKEDINNPEIIFDDFWHFVDENYIFFESKGVNWDSVYTVYRTQTNQNTTPNQLFDICSDALMQLKDGHSFIKSEFATSKVYDFRQGYEIHFSLNVVRTYFSGSLIQDGMLHYGVRDSIGYVYFEEMNDYGSFVEVVKEMTSNDIKGLIIDLRDNSGGDSNPVPSMLSNFVSQKTLLGSYIEKSGPKHNDITQPLPVFANPSSSFIDIPIVVITNRNSFSAASYFAGMLLALPNVQLIGQKSGGGAGGNYGYQLINGWIIKVSVSDFLDFEGKTIELGVEPEIIIENNQLDVDNNIDRMLEKALDLLQ